VLCEIEQARGLCVNLQGQAPAIVHTVHDVVVTVTTEFLLDAHRLLLCQRAQFMGLRFEFALDQHFAGACHAAKLPDPQGFATS
jgi:hypothetical protein